MGFKTDDGTEYDPVQGLHIGFRKRDGVVSFSTYGTLDTSPTRLRFNGQDKLQLFPVGYFFDGAPMMTLVEVVQFMASLYGLVTDLDRDDDIYTLFILSPQAVCRRKRSGKIDRAHIRKLLGNAMATAKPKATGLEALPENDLPEAVLLLERHMIMKALHRHDGFVDHAAKALKLTRSTLNRKIRWDEALSRYLKELRSMRRSVT